MYKEPPAKKKAESPAIEDNKEKDATLSTDTEIADTTAQAQPLVVNSAAATASKTSLYKPPTFEELQNLKEAEMLFQSNLLKLQVHSIPSLVNQTLFLGVALINWRC